MAYLRYLRSILFGFLLGCILFLLAVFYQIGAPTEGNNGFDELFTSKSHIANSLKTPKLVVVAGSNALYGISCKTLHEETSMPCVNGGTGAGVGVDYVLYRARSWLKPRDIVLLPLEYEFYKDDGTPSNLLVNYVFSRDPKYLLSVDIITQIRLIGGISFERLKQGVVAKLNPTQPRETDKRYKNVPQYLNEYGDRIDNQEGELSEDNLKYFKSFLETDIHKRIKLIDDELKKNYNSGFLQTTYGIKSINKFVEWCKINNIQVIATWPNTLWFDGYKEPQQQNFFQSIEKFYKSISVPILGKPEDFMYSDRSIFFDTIYHLNDKGVRYRNQQLLTLLQPYLQEIEKSRPNQ